MLGLIVVAVGLVATRSDRGQAALRGWVENRLAGVVHGRVHIGRVSGNWLTGVTVDSLELRDDEDSLFVATGPLRVEYDPRDLVDRRLHVRRVDLLHPTVVLRQHENWTWNFKRMFSFSAPRPGNGPERGFGDFVVIDSVHIRDASFRVTIPWHPDDSLHAARRDSAIRVNVARQDHEIRRTAEGYTQTYRWTGAYAAAPYIRIADPDSVGKLFVIDTMHAVESTPPFTWRNVRGMVRMLGDSVWMTASHFDLPGSTGHGAGKVWWGSDLPVRYAVRIWGDSVSLKDVAWVYPTLPTTGGGTMILDIRNERDLQQLDYALSAMDVRTTKSHLTGAMTFETGGKVLSVHDVHLKADPVDWDLLRTLNGKPFPADWQGKLTGTVSARGGPLNRFMVDAADFTFADAHVPGAVSRMKGHGELDILLPAFTAFHHFSAQADRLELRTLSAIYPAFPKLGGYVAGNAVLDSSWLDVRVSSAQLAHFDGPAEPTRATGGGRITYGTKYMKYDLDLVAAPLSLTTLARSYPKLPLRGTLSGPIAVQGMAPDLTVSANLTGAAGHLTYAGHVDADSVGGYGARGAGSFEALDAAILFGLAKPATRLAGSYDVDLLGDSLANLVGPLAVRLQRSEADGVRIAEGAGRVRFERGIVRIDSLDVTADPGRLRAQGVLGLTRNAGTDSLLLAVEVDSLGGLRRYLASAAPAGTVQRTDTLRGRLAFRGSARGWLDSLDVRGALTGRSLVLNATRAAGIDGDLVVHDVRGHTTGAVNLRADTLLAGGLRIAAASLAAQLMDHGRARFVAGMRTDDGSALRGVGGYAAAGDTARLTLDSLSLALGASRWALHRPLHAVRSPAGIFADTLVLADATGGLVRGSLAVPTGAAASIHLRGDSLPLGDLARLAQLSTHVAGRLDLALDVAGTRDAPTVQASARARDFTVGSFTSEALSFTASYARQRAELAARLSRGGRALLDATVDYPVALTLFSAHETGDSLRGRIRADSVDLALLQAVATQVQNATGRLSLDLALSGTAARPHVGGAVLVQGGAFDVPDAGVRLSAIDGRIAVDAAHDSLSIGHLRWTSPANRGTASLQGSLVYRDLANPRLDLRLDASGFRAVDKRNFARLDVSTGASGLRLTGSLTGAALRGGVVVDRGTIFIPELLQKKLVDLTADDFAMFFDTTDVRTRSLMPRAPGRLVEHLRLDGVTVGLGEDVWLKSKEANIRLGGSLDVTRALDARAAARGGGEGDSARYVLALTGSLSADRGTYLLDLTPVQREFQVQSGRITFFGTTDFNPEIDVTALYNVKQGNRADIGIRARIFGNFYPQPALDLSSTDAYLSPSDLVSYLVSGRASFEQGGLDVAASQRFTEFVLPTANAVVSRALRDQLGGFVDLVQIQSGAIDPLAGGDATSNKIGGFLYSTRLGGEKQIKDRLFLSFSTGLCQLPGSETSQQGVNGFVNAIEGKLEYRFPMLSPDRLALRAGREPAASALRCGHDQVRGFVATPQQWGFSVFRSWAF